MFHKKIILLGGSGFIGQQLAIALANRNYQVRVPCRRPHRHRDLLVQSNISVVGANILDSSELDELCRGQDAVINLVGILHERDKDDFQKMHVEFIRSVVEVCTNNKIRRLLHLSALGADQASGSSMYLRSKGEGENLLHSTAAKDMLVTSFQPSVVFGKNDQFINRFAAILKYFVGYFPLACPHSQLAPVYVGDLVERIVASLDNPATHAKRFTICGPEVFTLQQILELIIQTMQWRYCRVLPLGDGLSRLQAKVLQVLPGKLFTMDNYASLQTPNICKDGDLCTTSLRQYLRDLKVLFNNKKYYDRYRQQYAGEGFRQADSRK